MATTPALDYQQALTFSAFLSALDAARANPRRRYMRITAEEVVDALAPGADDKRKAATAEVTRYGLADLDKLGLLERHVNPANRTISYLITELGEQVSAEVLRSTAGTSPQDLQAQRRRDAAQRTRDRLRGEIEQSAAAIVARALTATSDAELIADDGRTIVGALDDLVAHLASALKVLQEPDPGA